MRFTKIIRFLSLSSVPFLLFSCSPSPPSGDIDNTGDPAGRIASAPLCVMTAAEDPVLVQKPGDDVWQNGETGMSLGLADRVKTETRGRAALTFFDGSTIELDEETEVSLKELDSSDRSTRIKIQQEIGRTVNRVKKLADPASRYEIETGACVAAVRGTEFWIDVLPDGTTVVSNIDGLIGVIAQGIEIILQPGMQSTVVPGQPPGQPVSNIEPTVAAVATTLPTPTAPPDTRVAGLTTTYHADRSQAFPGDTVVFSSEVTNSGTLPLSGLSVNCGLPGMVYTGGDAGGDGLMDAGETWQYTNQYLVQAGDAGQLLDTVVASGVGEGSRQATASADVVLDVLNIIVQITSLEESQTVSREITVAGTVNDPSITQAVISVNGVPANIPVTGGTFSTLVTLSDGVNIITVTISKPGGISASRTVELEPAP